MKKFYRIFLASVLTLSLLTGSIGIPAFAEEMIDAEIPEEELSGTAPERDYYPINHTNPLNYVADTGNISGQLVNWVYIENDGKEKGPEQTAVTLGAANGHRNNVGLTNIYIHVNYAGEQVTQSEPTALHVFAENEGTADITLGGMAIAETAGSNGPGDPTAIKAESSSGGQTTVTAEGQVIAGEDTEGLYLDHTLVNASSTGEGSSTAVTLLSTANGDVKISAADGGTSVINIDNEGQGLGRRATLSSNDDGSLAQLNLKEGNVSEIRFRGEDGTREANINGDVKIQVESYFAGGEANANITGNVGDPNASQGGINATVKEGGTANYDVDGTIYGHVYLNENRNEDHLDGANINVQAANVEGEVSIGSQHDGKYNVTIEEDITAKEDALKIRNNNSEVNVDVQGSITSNGGTGIAVNNVGDLEWVEAGTFDNVDDLPAGRNELKSILNPATTGDEVTFTLDHKSTLNENTEQYNDDILYEYTTDVYTDTPIPLHKDNDPDNPTMSRWGINDEQNITVVYPGNTYKKYEITGEEYKPETQTTYARERIDYENTDVTNVNVGEDLIVKGESKELTGISVRSDNKFNETNINIGDNVKVTSLDTNEEGDHTATGIRVDALEGDININVATDLVVEGGVNDTGIVLNRHAHEEFAASDAEKVNPEDLNGISLGDQIIDGKVVQVYEAEQEDGTALYYDEEGNVYDCVTVANEGTTQIVIGRDVISGGNGVELSAAGEERTDLIIDGSLVATGGTSVVLKDDTTLGNNLTLTVWEMTADRDGDYVKREEYDEKTDSKKLVADREAEKAIQYIIRVDPSQEGIIHTNGTRDYKGREVANEGDIIVLKIDVPAGLMIDEVYGDQAHNKLIQDSYGNYFMIVPRGGGVLFSVILKDYVEPEPEPQPEPKPQPDPEPKPVPQPDPEPKPAPEPDPEPKPEPKPEPQPEPKPEPKPEPQPEPQPIDEGINKPAEIAVHVVRPLLSVTDITGSVQLNCFRGGTFTVHLLKGRNTYTGKITLYSDGTMYLIGPDGLEMPINEKGDFTLIVGSERFSFVFTAADLAVLRACLP